MVRFHKHEDSGLLEWKVSKEGKIANTPETSSRSHDTKSQRHWAIFFEILLSILNDLQSLLKILRFCLNHIHSLMKRKVLAWAKQYYPGGQSNEPSSSYLETLLKLRTTLWQSPFLLTGCTNLGIFPLLRVRVLKGCRVLQRNWKNLFPNVPSISRQ